MIKIVKGIFYLQIEIRLSNSSAQYHCKMFSIMHSKSQGPRNPFVPGTHLPHGVASAYGSRNEDLRCRQDAIISTIIVAIETGHVSPTLLLSFLNVHRAVGVKLTEMNVVSVAPKEHRYCVGRDRKHTLTEFQLDRNMSS